MTRSGGKKAAATSVTKSRGEAQLENSKCGEVCTSSIDGKATVPSGAMLACEEPGQRDGTLKLSQ